MNGSKMELLRAKIQREEYRIVEQCHRKLLGALKSVYEREANNEKAIIIKQKEIK